ncbi:hypothetical protein LX32DRAFT_355965 [Colletotrichum zoysiae]|uniref:Uncharacterized protein n=1 Tax=Colletotrichum zoysiae TaxID=1216348 RepID=A0AAD9HIJ2_9PEZI|nr:hypothetical protein LX32DRAFT_355965 [Colletotrichum zoysiae]
MLAPPSPSDDDIMTARPACSRVSILSDVLLPGGEGRERTGGGDSDSDSDNDRQRRKRGRERERSFNDPSKRTRGREGPVPPSSQFLSYAVSRPRDEHMPLSLPTCHEYNTYL